MRTLVFIALVGCGVPALQLDYRIDNTSEQSCHTDNCEDISISCGAVESIRIFDPMQPSAPFLSQCQVIPQTKTKSLCSIVQIGLDQAALIPEQTLAVQVVVYPADKIPIVDGKLVCPTEKEGLDFDSSGRPMGMISMQDPNDPTVTLSFAPALGGLAYWHPGDSDVTVTLACNDLASIGSVCNKDPDVNTTVHVFDFDNNIQVSKLTSENLLVGIGEPTHTSGGTDFQYDLSAAATTQLDRHDETIPFWTGDVSQLFSMFYCVEVIDSTQAQITPELTCFDATGATTINANGFRITNDRLKLILEGRYGKGATVPTDGITIGVVYRDSIGVQDKVVHSDHASTIHYLDADYVDRGATKTSSLGIFVVDKDDNVPFGTHFTTTDATGKTVSAVGGNVHQKITLVVLQYPSTPSG